MADRDEAQKDTMKTMIKFAGLLTVVLLVAAGSAKADGVRYTITFGTDKAVFTLPQSPTLIASDILTNDLLPPGSDFEIFNVSGTVNGVAETFNVLFVTNYGGTGMSGLDVGVTSSCTFCAAFNGFEWGTTSLFSGTDDNPLLVPGPYALGRYSVDATQVPEPSSLLLLGLGGIAVLALGLKRAA
jgi:hypothetical protein